MNSQLRVVPAILFAAIAATSQSIVAYSNFGPDHAYAISGGWTVSGPTSGFPTQIVAFQFTAQASGLLESVLIPMGHVGGTNIGRVILYNDSGLNTVGDPRVQWTTTLAELGQPDLLTLPYTGSTQLLVAGTKYWLGTHYVVDDTWDAWNETTVTDAQLCGFSYNGGDDYSYGMQLPAGAFEVNVVPEPATMVALALGIGALRKRRVRSL